MDIVAWGIRHADAATSDSGNRFTQSFDARRFTRLDLVEEFYEPIESGRTSVYGGLFQKSSGRWLI